MLVLAEEIPRKFLEVEVGVRDRHPGHDMQIAWVGFCHGEMITSHSGYLLSSCIISSGHVVGFMSAKSEPAVNPMRGVCILYFSLYLY